MSYLLAQIVVCLLIAGLIGAVIGWFLRGGCSRKLRDCEDEWKMKMGSLESEYHSKLSHYDAVDETQAQKAMQAATLKRHAAHVEKEKPAYSYEEELKNKLNKAQNISTTASDSFDINTQKQALIAKGISLSDDKIRLYTQNGVDLTATENLEDNYYIENIEGIDPKQAQALREMGLKTTKDLVGKLNKNRDALHQVANTMQIEPSTLSSWISEADLMQLPGVNAKTAKMLQTVGISSVRELGITNAQSLYNEITAFNQKSKILPEVPSENAVQLWTKIAKLLG